MANLRTNNLSGTGGRNAIDGALFFNGDGHGSTNNINALALADSNDWHFDGDFTIECWINRGKIPTTSGAFLGQWESGGGTDRNVQLYVDTNGVVQGYMNRSTTNYQAGSVGALRSGEWHHIALVLEGSTLRFYWNGKQTQTASVSGTQNNSTVKFWVGAEDNGSGSPAYAFNGYLSNVRVVKGISLYKSGNTFAPPTEKLKEIDGTVLLCCQDSNDPTQEATGKTITTYGNISPIATERVNQGTFGGGTYSPSWTKFGPDTVTVQNGGVKIVRSSGLTGLYQLLTGSAIPAGQYRLRGVISNKTGPGGAIIRLTSATQGNGTNFFGAYGPGTIESTINYSGTGNLYMNLMIGNNTGSADFSNISFTNVVTKQTINLPPVGVDDGVVFDGDVKINSPNYMYFPTGDTSQRGRGRAVSWWGIYNTSGNYTKDVDYFDIQSLGTTTKFGEISDTVGLGAGMSSSTRGVFAGGSKPGVGNVNLLEYITIATTGNAIDFGGVSTTFRYGAGISNQTRGLIAGAYQGSGASGTLNTIQYITIANLGDTLDFGDMVADGGTGVQGMGACSSSTRGITFGAGTPTTINEMNYITIMSTGNSVDFGDLSAARYLCQGVSSSTRGVVGGGDNSGTVNIVEYITISSTGNATDFGDLTSSREYAGSQGASNGIRGVFIGGGDWPAGTNTMEYITIASTGNAKDFGDTRTAIEASYGSTTISDCHGGLS